VKDLEDVALIRLKAALFLLLGGLAASLLVLRSPSLTTAALVAVAVWSFCRLYYFAFYVIERYVDPRFRFSGLLSFVRYVVTRSPSTSS